MKKIIKYIFLSIVLIIVTSLLCFYIYASYRTRNFNKDGITFDSSIDCESYKDKLYYSQLSDDEKKIYKSLYHASINLEKSFMYEGYYVEDDYDRALNAFSMDFPEFFYWLSTSNVEEKLFGTAIVHSKSTYLFLDSIEEDYKLINEKANEILKETVSNDDYETIKNIHDYLIDNISYDHFTYNNYDPNSFEHSVHNDVVSALVENRTLCNGYASAFQLLASRAGYNCSIVAGIANKGLHAWNMIELNNKWYNVDVTYDEILLEDNSEIGTSYEYFLSTNELFDIDHYKDTRFDYPDCFDETYYFFRMPGFVCRSDDKTFVKMNMSKFLKEGEHEVSIKFTSYSNAQKTYDWLYTEGGIEELLEENIGTDQDIMYHYSFNQDSNLLYFYYE